MNSIIDPDYSDPTNIVNATYESFVLLNITSSQVPAAYGTLAHTAMLNAYLAKIA